MLNIWSFLSLSLARFPSLPFFSLLFLSLYFHIYEEFRANCTVLGHSIQNYLDFRHRFQAWGRSQNHPRFWWFSGRTHRYVGSCNACGFGLLQRTAAEWLQPWGEANRTKSREAWRLGIPCLLPLGSSWIALPTSVCDHGTNKEVCPRSSVQSFYWGFVTYVWWIVDWLPMWLITVSSQLIRQCPKAPKQMKMTSRELGQSPDLFGGKVQLLSTQRPRLRVSQCSQQTPFNHTCVSVTEAAFRAP